MAEQKTLTKGLCTCEARMTLQNLKKNLALSNGKWVTL